MAFHRAIEAGLADTEFELYGDGSQTRDFTYVDDAVAGTLAAGLTGQAGAIYNLGGGSQSSMTEVLDIVGEQIGQPLRITSAASQRGDAQATAADTTRARAELGFAPSRTLEQGLAEQVAWHRSRRPSPSPVAT